MVVTRVETRRGRTRTREVLLGLTQLPVPLRGRVCQLVSIYLTAIPSGLPAETVETLLANLAEHISEAPTTPQTEQMAVDVLAQTVQDLTQLRGGFRLDDTEVEPEAPVPRSSAALGRGDCSNETGPAGSDKPPTKRRRRKTLENTNVEETVKEVFAKVVAVYEGLETKYRGRFAQEAQQHFLHRCRGHTRRAMAAARMVQLLVDLVLQHDPPRKIAPLGNTMAETLDNLLDALQTPPRTSKMPPVRSDAGLIRRAPELQQLLTWSMMLDECHEDSEPEDDQLPTQQEDDDEVGLVQSLPGGRLPWRRDDREDRRGKRPPVRTKRKWLMPTRRRRQGNRRKTEEGTTAEYPRRSRGQNRDPRAQRGVERRLRAT